jgi:DegV family protein with EDD domain
MSHIRIVTDSTAHFTDPTFPARHNVTIVPLTIQIGRQTFQDGVDITTGQLFQRVKPNGSSLPTAAAPTPEQFAAVYEELHKSSTQIISIHASGKLSHVPHNARLGADNFQGRCKIIVIDSLSTSIGLGVLVEAAALAVERGETFDEVVKLVRGMVPRLYTVFFIETMDYLAQAGRIGKAQAVLGQMLGIKPFLTLEEGDIVPMEKVRTRAQAIEKMVEFVIEFSDIEQMGILQSSPQPTEDTRLLLERLALEFPGREWPVLAYGPALATLLGPDAMGVIIYEGESDPESASFADDDDDWED